MSIYWLRSNKSLGTPPAPVVQSVDSLILDGNGIILTTTVTLFPKFNYAHDGIFSFTLQYAQNTTGNLVWNSLPPNNFYSPFPGKTNSSGYIGGRITGVISIMNPLNPFFFLTQSTNKVSCCTCARLALLSCTLLEVLVLQSQFKLLLLPIVRRCSLQLLTSTVLLRLA